MIIKPGTSRIQDPVAQTAVRQLVETQANNPISQGNFRFLSFEITGTGSGIAIKHGLKFIPSDLLLTSVIWSGTVGTLTPRYASFDSESIYFNVTGQGADDTVKVRAMVGRMK